MWCRHQNMQLYLLIQQVSGKWQIFLQILDWIRKASASSQFFIFSKDERGFHLSYSMIKVQMSFDSKHSKHTELQQGYIVLQLPSILLVLSNNNNLSQQL